MQNIDVNALICEIKTWEGTPYLHQGRTRNGVDCVGLAIAALVAQRIFVSAPTNYGREAQGDSLLKQLEDSGLLYKKPKDSEIVAGDLLAFRIRRDPQHVAVALPDSTMIHADASANFVCSVHISPLWRMRIVQTYGWKG